MNNAWLISLLVNNHSGVLMRVTALFSRRGYNIASLSVGETHDPTLSRITIETRTDGAGVRQVMKQLAKLEDVQKVALLPRAEAVEMELLLIKLVASSARREAILDALKNYAVQIPYVDEGKIILQLTDTPERCEAFLEALRPFTISELCRTGITALSTV
ncbi:MAG: acetolactate synthase small subunit [Oscillospiraceae bacterium]|jgi:acetolactate synthase-1/3 small subunit|nr:acetolactate synthase small subunit [Oscillospiraceae bacterium]